MRERGIRVLSAAGDFEVRPNVIGSLEGVGPFDVIFLGVKAHGLTHLAPQLRPLIGGNTTVVGTQNGIPWWYFQSEACEFPGLHLERVDPGGVVGESIPPASVVASIVYLGTDIVEPGVIRHTEGNRISLGEPDGSRSERCRVIAEALIKSGLRCPITARIRHEIWVKILGNIAFNPISALTGATLVTMARDPDIRAVVRNMMMEVEAVAAKLGLELPISIDQRIAGAVVELGERLCVPMPHTKTVYACTRLLGATSAGRRIITT
jgi:2-dehydropantoate 2-reductase